MKNIGQQGVTIVEEASIDMGMLHPIELRLFEAKAVKITAETINVNVSGRKEPVTGISLYAENNRNPKPLEIIVVDGNVLQGTKPNVVFVPIGTITISGEKNFKELGEFQRKEGDLPQLPVRDPDLVKVDERTFRQTGTLQLTVANAKITLIKE